MALVCDHCEKNPATVCSVKRTLGGASIFLCDACLSRRSDDPAWRCSSNDFQRIEEVVALREFVVTKTDGNQQLPGACADCGKKYGDEFGFPDLIIDDDAWLQISPRGSEGGLLCPSCICRRLHAAGIKCQGRFTSGPLCEE